MSRNMIGQKKNVQKQWDAIVQKQENEEMSLNLKPFDDVKIGIEAYFLRLKNLMATYGKVIVGFEFEIEEFWNQKMKIATNLLCQKSPICCHKDTFSSFPTILSAFYLDHSHGGELFLPEIAFLCHYKMGDVVLMDGRQWHSVLPMVNKNRENAERFSVSIYNNKSPVKEAQAQQKKLKK